MVKNGVGLVAVLLHAVRLHLEIGRFRFQRRFWFF